MNLLNSDIFGREFNFKCNFRHGITILGFSGDGDYRLLGSMRHNLKNNSLSIDNELNCTLQDVVHIGTKLRNRLLNDLVALVVGTKVANVTHLKVLLNLVSKDCHGLVYSDICPNDRQNFASVKKIVEPKVREILASKVIDSDGTIEYIRICDEVISSLYDENLTPLERIFRIWRATYFLRAWRLFIVQSDYLNLDSNFITANAYACIELNAQNLLILIKKLRNEGLNELFLPTIFNSQPCEETFRKMRSMGTINFTKINFTLLELMHLVGRVQLMNDIMFFKLANVDIFFPRNPAHKTHVNTFELPTDGEIEETMLKASNAAVYDAQRFGICVTSNDIQRCNLKDVHITMNRNDQYRNNDNIDLNIASSCDDDTVDFENLKDYSNKIDNLNEGSSYVNVMGKNGSKIVRKSTLMWNYNDSKSKLSADRLQRVRADKKRPNRQLEFVDVTVIDKPIYRAHEIKTGDWCFFINTLQNDDSKTKFVFGNILSFQHPGTKYKDREYPLDFAPVLQNENVKKILVLALWYEADINGIVHSSKCPKCNLIDIENYVMNVLHSAIEKNSDGTICISQEFSNLMKSTLQHF